MLPDGLRRRCFPPPRTAEETNACFIVKDAHGRRSPGRRSAAKLLTRDEARHIAANIKTAGPRAPEISGGPQAVSFALMRRNEAELGSADAPSGFDGFDQQLGMLRQRPAALLQVRR
jgi:hypothetical protein